jgi:hypothetical protein
MLTLQELLPIHHKKALLHWYPPNGYC